MDCRYFGLHSMALFTLLTHGMASAACYALPTLPPDTAVKGSTLTQHMQCDYLRYSSIVSCPLKLPLVSWTRAILPDTGDTDTSSRHYKLDPQAASLQCQQHSNRTYSSHLSGYDVGHLTAIDLFDDNLEAALETNFMTNLVAQQSGLNRYGAWRRTELLAECYREDYENGLIVFAGTIAGENSDNDHYTSSHGLLKTPDRFWKIIYAPGPVESLYDAWIIDNSNSARASTLNHSRTTLDNIIEVLTTEDAALYAPVIDVINQLKPEEMRRITLRYNSACHRRNG